MYSRYTSQNDIALIKLKRPFNRTRLPKISPICLSSSDENIPKMLTITYNSQGTEIK